MFNNIDNSNIKLVSNGEINKNDLASIMELKNKPLIVKLDPKKSSSCLKGKKIEKINNSNKNNKGLTSKILDDEEKKRIKTPVKKLFIESDRDKVKESLSEYIKIDKFSELSTTTKNKSIKTVKLIPEKNHFKAVIYSQEIQKLCKNIE